MYVKEATHEYVPLPRGKEGVRSHQLSNLMFSSLFINEQYKYNYYSHHRHAIETLELLFSKSTDDLSVWYGTRTEYTW